MVLLGMMIICDYYGSMPEWVVKIAKYKVFYIAKEKNKPIHSLNGWILYGILNAHFLEGEAEEEICIFGGIFIDSIVC